MRVMILDDDPWIADLLKQLVLSIRPIAQVDCFGEVYSALEAWQQNTYQLVIADWNLPDASGVSLLQIIRKKDQKIPLVMITGRADRESVLAVRSLGVSAFFSKPFQIPRVVQCLETLLPSEQPYRTTTIHQDLVAYLNGLTASELTLPLFAEVKEKLHLGYEGSQLDFRELADNWQHDPALCLQLIAAANSSAYLLNGPPCSSLNEALNRLGGPTSVNLATTLALRQAHDLTNILLLMYAQTLLDEAERLSKKAVSLAQQCGLEPAPLHSAALLHRIGELCVLYHVQGWENQGNVVEDEALKHVIHDFAGPFAISLKATLGLPMALREVIGAAYILPTVRVRREQMVMRLAAATNNGEPAANLEKLRRLAGLA
jgi:HD-like signal output (HDOD) protein/CheY-like chemotaxis protein